MRLLSFAVGDYSSFGAVSGDGIVDLGRLLGEQYPTLGAVLRGGELHRAMSLGATSKATIALEEIRYLPTVPDPEKIICIGINYGNRNDEYKDGAEAPQVSQRVHAHAGQPRRPSRADLESAGIEPARLRGRDRARDRQGGPPHRERRRLESCCGAVADERGLGARLAAALEVQRDAGQELRALGQPRAVARHGRRDPDGAGAELHLDDARQRRAAPGRHDGQPDLSVRAAHRVSVELHAPHAGRSDRDRHADGRRRALRSAEVPARRRHRRGSRARARHAAQRRRRRGR